jgi:hypothetical protein
LDAVERPAKGRRRAGAEAGQDEEGNDHNWAEHVYFSLGGDVLTPFFLAVNGFLFERTKTVNK